MNNDIEKRDLIIGVWHIVISGKRGEWLWSATDRTSRRWHFKGDNSVSIEAAAMQILETIDAAERDPNSPLSVAWGGQDLTLDGGSPLNNTDIPAYNDDQPNQP